MSAPDDILNGDVPDATVLMEWFDFVRVKKDTYANIIAAGTGTDAFTAYATDRKFFMVYTGDATVGTSGFLIFAQGA